MELEIHVVPLKKKNGEGLIELLCISQLKKSFSSDGTLSQYRGRNSGTIGRLLARKLARCPLVRGLRSRRCRHYLATRHRHHHFNSNYFGR